MKRWILVLTVLFIGIEAMIAQQDETGKVIYEDGFRFKKGIYLTFEDWKENNPILIDQVFTELDPNSPKFFNNLFRGGEFSYIKDRQSVEKVRTQDIFGYSTGKEVFYSTSARFEEIGSIGLLREVGQVDTYSSFINPGEQEYKADRSEETGQRYLFDFEKGRRLKFSPKNFQNLLKRDPELFQQYKKEKGPREEKILKFLKRYNLRHPVYFRNS